MIEFWQRKNLALALAAGLVGACTGGVETQPGGGGNDGSGNPGVPGDDSNPMTGGGNGDTPAGPPSSLVCDASKSKAVGRTPLRRLTRRQLAISMQDMLGTSAELALALPEDDRAGPFPANASTSASDLHVRRYMDIAAVAATDAVGRLNEILPCSAQGTDECARQFIKDVGGRAFRRPLTDAQVEGLMGVFAVGKEGGQFSDGIHLTLQAILQSPQFLYHVEPVGPSDGGRTPVDPYALASRLSFFLWSAPPDDQLLQAAASGKLDSPEGLRAEAERLLQDPRSSESLASFALHWLDISRIDRVSKDTRMHYRFSDEVRTAMKTETTSFFDFVVRKGDGTLGTLMTAPFSFVSAPLLPIYGLGATKDFNPNSPIGLPPGQRAGILTQPAVMATHSHPDHTSPIKRGSFILKNLLCITIEPPNIEIPPLPEPDPTQTTRERFEVHTQNAGCASCHKVIDPIGFGFEEFDAIGVYRERDEHGDVDAQGELAIGDEAVDGAFDGALELVNKLTRSEAMRDCMPVQWHRFALGRYEQEEDACAIEELREEFAGSNLNVRELVLNLVTKDSFRFNGVSRQ